MATGFAQVTRAAQWAAAQLDGVRLRAEGGVELAWVAGLDEEDGVGGVGAAGLAFDRGCRLHRVTEEAGLTRVLWDQGAPVSEEARVPLFRAAEGGGGGGFEPGDAERVTWTRAVGLAADDGDRLFVATGDDEVVEVYDLWDGMHLASVSVAPDRPTDLATDGTRVFAALSGGTALARLQARGPVVRLALPSGVDDVSRVALAPRGALAVLSGAGTEGARVTVLHPATDALGRPVDRLVAGPMVAAPWGADVEFDGQGLLVVARDPGADFLRFRVMAAALAAERPLRARSYDGAGLARSPEGRIVYWGARGPRAASLAPVRHEATGSAVTARLDNETFRGRWGRLFVDAAVPAGSRLRVRCTTTDEAAAEADDVRDQTAPFLPLHCRGAARELPFTDLDPAGRVRTWEAPVIAEPGRFLWVELRLEGNTRMSPRVDALRVEHAEHDLVERLPRTFSRDEAAASFLRRYLAPLAGLLREADRAATHRHRLLVPRTAPAEVLPWLASFLGLALDRRWPEPTRRALVAEANALFRTRGTPASLQRFLELYVGAPVRLVEHFRLRGLGGALLRDEEAAPATAVLGGGFRVGGSIGRPSRSETLAAEPPGDDVEPDGYAHRFSVLVGRALTEEQLQVVHHILEVHRPAHTVYEVCTVGSGMRVGRGLHVGISSFVGPTGGFVTSQIGDIVLGRDSVVGRPRGRPRPDGSPPVEGGGEGEPC